MDTDVFPVCGGGGWKHELRGTFIQTPSGPLSLDPGLILGLGPDLAPRPRLDPDLSLGP